MTSARTWVGVVLALSFVPLQAFAWQQVKAGAAGARVYATPAGDAAVTGTVDGGKPITIGDKPNNGFYRCNAGHGLNGWCAEADLDLASRSAPKAAAAPPKSWTGGGGGGGSEFGHGARESQFYAGPLLGFGFWSAGTKFTFGADAGYRLNQDWGLGLYLTYTSFGSTTVSTITASASTFIVAPELNYFISGELKGLHLGAKLGLGFSSASLSSTTGTLPANTQVPGSATGLVFGVGAAYDYPVSHDITIGGEANFLILTSSSSTSSSGTGGTTTTTSSGSTSVFNILANAKYWF